MKFRVKAAVFRAIETLPLGHVLHRLGQRFVTGRYLPKITEKSLKTYMLPVHAFSAVPGASYAMEFGSGRGLITPLLLSHAGARKVYAYDLQRLASVEQVNAVIAQLATFYDGEWPEIADFDDLEQHYNIVYRAPGDARATKLPDHSVDFIFSTATMEHIPVDQMRLILQECRRILSDIGKISFTIDYHDHYASADQSIGFMNFYQFSQKEWRALNPGIHYQNRLRHSDYVALFEESELTIEVQRPIFDSWSESDLKRVTLHPDFEHYSHEDLTASNGYFILSDAGRHRSDLDNPAS